MGPNGMHVIESSDDLIKEQQPKQEIIETTESQLIESEQADDDNSEDTIAGYNTADILAAVNDSAENGIALISSWLGLTPNQTTEHTNQSSALSNP